MSSTNLEIEVKFFITDESAIRRRLLALGAVSDGRSFERNIRFEDTEMTLYRRRSLLRLRQDTRCTLTFKSAPPEESPEFKIFRELEVAVDDFDGMANILSELGYHQEQVYEKWRETLRLQNTHFCLDTLPYGTFLEIEGEGEDIRRFAERLGLSWPCRILKNYLRIFELLKDRIGLRFSDVTFQNFKTVPVDLAQHLDILVAENPQNPVCDADEH